MYRKLIVGALLVLIGGAGYYYHKAGVSELIAHDIENGGDRKNYGVSAMQVFSGTYECNENSGCSSKTQLVLEEDTTVDLNTIVNGEEVGLAQGTWGVGQNGALVFIFQKTELAANHPTSLIAKKINSMKIGGFSSKKALFPGMKDPTFTRIKGADQKAEGGQEGELN